ncbi:MAG: hypothetical protein ACFE94_18280 [Candidatus Hodarchaeota archaeon]
MNGKEITDEELEEELDKAFKASESKRDVFSIIRKEKESLEAKEKRIRDKFKP